MPTINPRVNVTLSPSLFALVEDLATHQRVSRSAVMRDLLESVEPGLAQVVAMMKAANELSDAAKDRLRLDLDETISSIELKRDKAMALAAGVEADLVAQAEAIRGRRPARAAGKRAAARSAGGTAERSVKPKRPPTSKRGVKS